MARTSYDNLPADPPTDLSVGARWRPVADGSRFDVTDQAPEEVTPR